MSLSAARRLSAEPKQAAQREIRRPKSEIRKKVEIRRPNPFPLVCPDSENGRIALAPNPARGPLTPALSPAEGEGQGAGGAAVASWFLPLPVRGGKGRGEGAGWW